MDSVNRDIIHKGLPRVLIVYVQPQKGSVSPPGIFHLLGEKNSLFCFYLVIFYYNGNDASLLPAR